MNIIGYKTINFQQISDDDVQIAKEYKINYSGNKDNIWIYGAFNEIIKICNTKYIIFCENDWVLTKNE